MLIHRYAVQRRGHSGLILQMADELLAEAGMRLNQLDASQRWQRSGRSRETPVSFARRLSDYG